MKRNKHKRSPSAQEVIQWKQHAMMSAAIIGVLAIRAGGHLYIRHNELRDVDMRNITADEDENGILIKIPVPQGQVAN